MALQLNEKTKVFTLEAEGHSKGRDRGDRGCMYIESGQTGFKLYGEIMLREGQSIGGVNIGGDIVLLAITKRGLRQQVGALREASSSKALKLNVKKTKMKVIGKK